MNPDSHVAARRDGTHGHIYLYYRHGGSEQCDVVMIGCEGSRPRKPDQYGGLHDHHAGSGEFSPTGGLKWRNLKTGPGCRFYDGVYWKDHPGTRKHKKERSKKCPKGDITADTMMIVLDDNYHTQEWFSLWMDEDVDGDYLDQNSTYPAWSRRRDRNRNRPILYTPTGDRVRP
jgi:hypothetical protein